MSLFAGKTSCRRNRPKCAFNEQIHGGRFLTCFLTVSCSSFFVRSWPEVHFGSFPTKTRSTSASSFVLPIPSLIRTDKSIYLVRLCGFASRWPCRSQIRFLTKISYRQAFRLSILLAIRIIRHCILLISLASLVSWSASTHPFAKRNDGRGLFLVMR